MDPARRRASLITILISIAIGGMGWGLSSPMLGLLMNEMGASRSLIGFNTAMPALATLASTPLIPPLMARFGVRPVLMASLIMALVSFLSFKLIPDLYAWFFIRFAFGVAMTGMFVATEVWVNLVAEDHNRGRILGLYGTCLACGFAIGAALLGVLGSAGWTPFLVAGAIFALPVVLLSTVPTAAPALDEHQGSASLLPFLSLAPLAMAAGIIFGAVEMGIFNLLPVYGVRTGLSEAEAAGLLVAVGLGNVALQIPIGALADRLNRPLILTLCAGMGLLGAILVPWTVGVPLLAYLVLFAMGGAVVGLYTVGLTVLGDRFKGASLARANAAFVMMYGVGSLAGPPGSGIAMDLWDPHGLMAVLGGLCAAFVVFSLVLSLRPAQVPAEPDPS